MDPKSPLRNCGSVAAGSGPEEPIGRASAHARLAGLALGVGVSLLMMSSAASAQGLLEVFQLAQRSDPEFLAMGAEHRADQETRTQAEAGLLPSARMSLDTEWNERHRRHDYHSYNVTLHIEFPIYRHDRRIAIDQADSRIARADALYAAALQDLVVRVAERYFAVLAAEDEFGFAQATLEAFKQQLVQSQERFDVGLLAITDVEEAKAGFDLSRAQLIAAENALHITREALRETTGEYWEKLTPLGELPLAMPDPADIGTWTAIALQRNLRLLAARYDTETARREIERIQATNSPTLDAFGSIGLHDSESRSGDNRHGSIGLRLNVPIYSGGSVLSRTRESRHRLQRTLDLLERERRRTQRETREAYLGVSSGISRVHALEQAVRSSHTAAEKIQAGFEVGTRTSVDVLDAQSDLFRARRDLSEARYRYILNILRLKHAAGILSEDDLRQFAV